MVHNVYKFLCEKKVPNVYEFDGSKLTPTYYEQASGDEQVSSSFYLRRYDERLRDYQSCYACCCYIFSDIHFLEDFCCVSTETDFVLVT